MFLFVELLMLRNLTNFGGRYDAYPLRSSHKTQLPKPYRSHEGTQLYSNITQAPILSQYPRILAPQSVPADYSKYV